MTVDTELEAPEDQQAAPPDDQSAGEQGEDESGSGGSSPQPEQTAREKELERRLRHQGQQLATANRIATQAAAVTASLQSDVAALRDRMSANDKADAERRERETQNYLNSLPPEQRTTEELRLLKAEIRSIRASGTAVQTTRPAVTPEADDPEVAYMRARAQEILTNVQDEFGVELTRQDIDALAGTGAWESEDAFNAAVTRLAAKKYREAQTSGGSTVATKQTPPARETEAEMRERLTREITEGTGAGSPATPRAAGRPGRRPTDEDVRATVSSYNSAAGPKASIARLKQQREQMHKK